MHFTIHGETMECRNNNIEDEEWSAKGISQNDYPEVFVNYFVNARRPGKGPPLNSPQGPPIILIERWNIA